MITIKEEAFLNDLLSNLKTYYGEDAQYRDGQEEAIRDVLQGRRTLVVQKTGWGKSLVYFMATKVIRERTGRITLIISPLLALMNNQIESASKLDLQVRTINSENTEEWDNIFEEMNEGCIDALIISPERLANQDFKDMLIMQLTTQIGLFVVDEAHCISDWGHDFRPDYRRIIDIVNLLPPNIPVLATTATANNRVVEDIKKQLGENLAISRGNLTRDSLSIQVIELASKEERLAWLSENVKELPGTGIIYCLTIRDCELVYNWLNSFCTGKHSRKKWRCLNMVFSENAMCAILLCSYLGIKSDDSLKPLSLGEWNTLLEKLEEGRKEPGVILQAGNSWAEKTDYPMDFIKRINDLASRGANVAFELDDLDKKGIQVITQFDADYPILLRRKLKKKMPPVLYYAGNISLAKKIGIAVAGSRNVDDDGMEFTRRLVEKASKEKLVIYSGGAKGVDTVSESTAIKSGSAVVSFIADSLISKIKKKQVIEDIISGNLLLISDVKPDAGFSAARAMNRNKYIYASSYGAFVVSSDYNKGGTWNGAVESIHNGWTKTLIWDNKNYAGNQKLIEKGGIPYEITEESIYSVITKKEETYAQLDLFHTNSGVGGAGDNLNSEKIEIDNNDVYDIIKGFIVEHLSNGMSVEDVSKNLNVVEGQMTIWLKRLCNDKLIRFDKGLYKKA